MTDVIEFRECDTCRAKPGSPVLCSGCLHNRAIIEACKTGADIITRAEMIDLRALLSVAIWIRGEQVLPRNNPVLIINDGVSIPLCQAQMNRAQQLWKKLTQILGADIPKASWE